MSGKIERCLTLKNKIDLFFINEYRESTLLIN